jgi:hypothetical protein
MVNAEMMTATNSFIESLSQSLPQGRGAPSPEFMQGFMRIMIYVSLATFYVLTTVKAAFYLFSFVYLQKPKIKALFTDPAALAGATK